MVLEKGRNAIIQLISFLDTLALGSTNIADYIHLLAQKIGMENNGFSLGINSQNENGGLTFNVGVIDINEEQTGQRAKPLAIGGGTYAKVMPNIVAFGPQFPGKPVVEHQPNEYIEIKDLILDAKIYAQAIYELSQMKGKL
jgi:hypothetical protein